MLDRWSTRCADSSATDPPHRRERHRQGAGWRARSTSGRRAGAVPSWPSTARPCPRPARVRAVRLREGRLHRRGARRKDGRFELADGGTLFLDEVGDLVAGDPGQAPARAPGGRVRAPRRHRDRSRSTCASWRRRTRTSAQMVKEKRFREDLYYRLNVITIRVPPLRERREDVRAPGPALPELLRGQEQSHAWRASPTMPSGASRRTPGRATFASWRT